VNFVSGKRERYSLISDIHGFKISENFLSVIKNQTRFQSGFFMSTSRVLNIATGLLPAVAMVWFKKPGHDYQPLNALCTIPYRSFLILSLKYN